jgi:HSP20 family molecular chaperone IbpA
MSSMNEETQKYFSEINNVNAPSNDTGAEHHIELAKSGSSSTKKQTLKSIRSEAEGQLTLDVYQTKTQIIVESTIAGVAPGDLDIEITPESVTIRGERQKEDKVEEDDYLYQECFWGSFSRSIILPQEVDADKAEATLKNGVLKIKLPKINREKSKKVKVNFV